MNKSELITKVSEVSGVSESEVGKVVNSLTAVIKDTLIAGDKVKLVGFGNFEVVNRAARKCRNPRTGEEVMSKPSKSAKFYPGGPLKDALNQ